MTILTVVPENGGAEDVLAARYRTAFNKMEGGRAQWIEGTLELADVVFELRTRYSANQDFGHWVRRYQLPKITPGQCAALVGFARMGKVSARELLEQSKFNTWRSVWEKRPNKPRKINRPSRSSSTEWRTQPAHPPSPPSRRQPRIPDVMREDYEPQQNPQSRPTTRRQPRIPDVMRKPPPPPKKQSLTEYFLTPEQIDPDFKGTALEFATKYGHVPLQTKEQIELVRRQETLSAWLGSVADHARTAQVMLTALAAVDPATLQQWLSKPGKTEKLRTWCNSMEVACEAIRKLKGTVS